MKRFWAKVDKSGSCWMWTAATDKDGYGKFWNNAHMRAHRVSWELASGRPVPDGMLVLHECDNAGCVNPEHLWLGTDADNARDCADKMRSSAGVRHGMAKLNDSKVRAIRAMRGVSQREMARDFRVSQRTIFDVVSGKTWRLVS